MLIQTYDPLNSVSPSFSLVTYFFVFCLYLYVLLNSVWEITTQEIFSEDPSFALLPNVFSMLDAKRMYDVLVSSFSIFFKNDDSKMLLGQILTVFDSEKNIDQNFLFCPSCDIFFVSCYCNIVNIRIDHESQ